MESQPQNPEFRNNPENFHPCIIFLKSELITSNLYKQFSPIECWACSASKLFDTLRI